MTPHDRRQLVWARNRLLLAARNAELALEHLGGPTSEAELRALWAASNAEDAHLALHRFARRCQTRRGDKA